jgi:hypothetical protein
MRPGGARTLWRHCALNTARQRGNRRAIKQLEEIGQPPHITVKQFTARARWVANFGGLATGANFSSQIRALLVGLIRSPDYSAMDVIRAVRGVSASQAAEQATGVVRPVGAHAAPRGT